MTREKLVIVGNGMAAGKLIESLLEIDPDRFQITVIGDEPYGNYNRIKLVVKLKEADLSDFFLNTPDWYQAHQVRACLGSPVTDIDRQLKTVILENGDVIAYDTLVLATGSTPFIPPMTGLELPGIFALRKLDDVAQILQFLDGKSHIMVVGGGILGLELALMLRLLCKRVTVSHLMPTLMELQLSEAAGRYLQQHLEDLGIQFMMNTYITQLKGTTAGVSHAIFKNDQIAATEAVFFNCGIRPNTALARKAGLIFNKGISVNHRLQTSDPAIFACGECIEFQHETWGLVAPVYEQARVLAAILTGSEVVYAPSPSPPTRLKSDIPVISMGRTRPAESDEVTLFTDPHARIYKQLIIRDNVLVGATLVGDDLNADLIALYTTAKLPVPARRSELLFPGASAGDGIVDGKSIPDDAQICDCNGVSAAKIRHSIKAGNDTLYKVMLATKAGTGCGNCKNKLKALLISEVGELRVDPADSYYVAGIPMDRPTLTAFISDRQLKSCSQVFAALPDAVDDSKTRMGLDYLLNYIWKSDYRVENDSRCANDRFSGNIQKDGRYSVIPNIAGGVATSAQLRAIADASDKYGAMIKITGADRIGLYSIHKKDLRPIWTDLQMQSGHAFTKAFRACKGCVGSTHCRFGLNDSLSLGQLMGDRYRGMMGPAKVKMGVSGCPRNCSEATIKDFGVVAVEDGWEIFVGGNGGSHVIAAKPIARVKTTDEILAIADRYYEYYRRHGKYGERTAYFINRVGLNTVVDAILHAPADDLTELEHAFAQARANYRDPWTDSDTNLNNEIDTQVEERSDHWYPVTAVADLAEGESRQFTIHQTPLAIFHNRDTTWVAASAFCPHKGGPVVDSIYGNGRLVCPLHSYSFDCKTGVSDNPDISAMTIYPTRISDGWLWVEIT